MRKFLVATFALASIGLVSCGSGEQSPEDAAKEWCDCVSSHDGQRDAEECVKLLNDYSEGKSNEEVLEYSKAQEDCLHQ